MRKRIDAVAAEAELLKGKRVLRAEKKKAKKLKGDKLERANMERSIETLATGVEAGRKIARCRRRVRRRGRASGQVTIG
jgi:hypothetical protein